MLTHIRTRIHVHPHTRTGICTRIHPIQPHSHTQIHHTTTVLTCTRSHTLTHIHTRTTTTTTQDAGLVLWDRVRLRIQCSSDSPRVDDIGATLTSGAYACLCARGCVRACCVCLCGVVLCCIISWWIGACVLSCTYASVSSCVVVCVCVL